MRKTSLRILSNPVLFLLLFISLSYFIFSCKKSDQTSEQPPPEMETEAQHRFFDLPNAASLQLKTIAARIKKDDSKYHFLEDFIKRAGYPRWDKAKTVTLTQGTITGRLGSDSSNEQLIYVPFVKDSANSVNSVLAVKMTLADTAFRMLYANKYRSFGYDTTDRTKWNARDVFHLFTLLDNSVFGHTQFLMKDPMILNTPTGTQTIVTLKTNTPQSITGRNATNRININETILECTTYITCPPMWARVTTDGCTSEIVCTTYSGGGGNGSTGDGDWIGTGSSGGGNGGTVYYWNDPCAGSGNRISRELPPYGNCEEEPGWEVLYDPYHPFANLKKRIDYPDDPVVYSNGIQITDVPQNAHQNAQILIGQTTNRGNTEDMEHGTDGDGSGIIPPATTANGLFDYMTTLFHECTVFDDDLRTVGDLMIQQFRNKTGGSFSNNILNEKVLENSAFLFFLGDFGKLLQAQLTANGGNINALQTINMGQRRPIFNSLYNKFHGLQILLNDTEFTQIYLDNFELSPTGTWNADVTVVIHDHFGLDKNDALAYQSYDKGFPAWWWLQHKLDYVPFETVVTVRKRIKGSL